MDLHETFREGWQWVNEQMIKFWWQWHHHSNSDVITSPAHDRQQD